MLGRNGFNPVALLEYDNSDASNECQVGFIGRRGVYKKGAMTHEGKGGER